MMKASQKVGAETPTRETARARWSIHESRFTAASTPSGRPNSRESRNATVDSSIVAGAYCAMSSITGRCEEIEAPFVAVGLDDRRVIGGDVAKLRQHRVARHCVGDQENDQRGEQHHRHGNKQTRGDIARQAIVPLPFSAAYRTGSGAP